MPENKKNKSNFLQIEDVDEDFMEELTNKY
jgi:hypothetical protein